MKFISLLIFCVVFGCADASLRNLGRILPIRTAGSRFMSDVPTDRRLESINEVFRAAAIQAPDTKHNPLFSHLRHQPEVEGIRYRADLDKFNQLVGYNRMKPRFQDPYVHFGNLIADSVMRRNAIAQAKKKFENFACDQSYEWESVLDPLRREVLRVLAIKETRDQVKKDEDEEFDEFRKLERATKSAASAANELFGRQSRGKNAREELKFIEREATGTDEMFTTQSETQGEMEEELKRSEQRTRKAARGANQIFGERDDDEEK